MSNGNGGQKRWLCCNFWALMHASTLPQVLEIWIAKSYCAAKRLGFGATHCIRAISDVTSCRTICRIKCRCKWWKKQVTLNCSRKKRFTSTKSRDEIVSKVGERCLVSGRPSSRLWWVDGRFIIVNRWRLILLVPSSIGDLLVPTE